MNNNDKQTLAEQMREWAKHLRAIHNLSVRSDQRRGMLSVCAGLEQVANDLAPRLVTTRIAVERDYSEDYMYVEGGHGATPMHRWWRQVCAEFDEVGRLWMPEGESCVELEGIETRLDGDRWLTTFDLRVTHPQPGPGETSLYVVRLLFFDDTDEETGTVAGTFTLRPDRE